MGKANMISVVGLEYSWHGGCTDGSYPVNLDLQVVTPLESVTQCLLISYWFRNEWLINLILKSSTSSDGDTDSFSSVSLKDFSGHSGSNPRTFLHWSGIWTDMR